MIKKIFYFIVCVLAVGCSNNIFYSDVPKLLNLEVKDLEYKNIYSIESIAGITGEGAILEMYLLSDEVINMFLRNGIKELPKKEGYNKINWKQGKCSFTKNMEGFVNYMGNDKLEKELSKLREVLCQNNIYTSIYYNGNTIENSLGIQLMVVDIANKKFYIYEIDI